MHPVDTQTKRGDIKPLTDIELNGLVILQDRKLAIDHRGHRFNARAHTVNNHRS